jgi:hypothetical protein
MIVNDKIGTKRVQRKTAWKVDMEGGGFVVMGLGTVDRELGDGVGRPAIGSADKALSSTACGTFPGNLLLRSRLELPRGTFSVIADVVPKRNVTQHKKADNAHVVNA